MTNSERIQANNRELQVCIDKGNALPYAGGGQYEVWTITYVDGTIEEKKVAVL